MKTSFCINIITSEIGEDIMSGNILDLINGIASGDASASKLEFDSIMASKMQDVLDTQRIQVAGKFYNDVPVVEDETSEE